VKFSVFGYQIYLLVRYLIATKNAKKNNI